MLEENLSKIYWTVGAVIVVGAMIAIISTAFPDLMKGVIDVFKEKLQGR